MIAVLMVAFGGVTGAGAAGAEFWDDGAPGLGDAQAETSARAPIKATVFTILIDIPYVEFLDPLTNRSVALLA